MRFRKPAAAIRWKGSLSAVFLLTTPFPLMAQTLHAPTSGADRVAQQAMYDALTNSAETVREKNYREGLIDFALIRQTDIHSGPPQFPEALKSLDGQTVRLIGFMNPYDSIETMKHCLIWEQQTGCYFCKPPGFLEAVYVHQAVRRDEKLPFIEGLVLVTGKLRLWKGEDDYLFLIEEAKAEPYRPGAKKKFLLF